MSVERVMVNGHELTAFDLPPEPSETYTVYVDGLGEIVVEKGEPPKEKDVPAMYMRKLVPELCEQNSALFRENAKLREYLAVSIPLPLDRNRSAIHPDDVIGNNVGGTDFFRRVTEMYLTRYPRDGQPALWVVRTEDDDGNVSPYVCWGGRCNAVHKQASQTYSAEYLETYDENKQLKAENAKLRELVSDAHACKENDGCCEDCYADEGDCPIERRMRELGVEVDG